MGRRCKNAAVVNVIVAVPGAVTVAGETAQLPCKMVAEQDRATDPVKPPEPPTVMVAVPGVPFDTEAVAGMAMLKS